MVLFFLCMKAELENVESISLRNDANLCLSVRNPLSDYEVREKVVMNPSELIEQDEGSRESPHHLALKWDGSKKASILTVLNEAEAKTALKKMKKGKNNSSTAQPPSGKYTADDSGSWRVLLAVETRGLEPYAFFPSMDKNNGDFLITSSSGKQFTQDVDLSEGDWADYDEENDGKSFVLFSSLGVIHFMVKMWKRFNSSMLLTPPLHRACGYYRSHQYPFPCLILSSSGSRLERIVFSSLNFLFRIHN
jgi:Eukaryotic protein of unknown function (DUF866)